MIKIKRILLIILIVLSASFIITYSYYLYKNSSFFDNQVVIKDSNDYVRDYQYLKFKQIDNFEPHNYDELVNIYYNVLNRGWDNFTFYCGKDYNNCTKDVNLISNDEDLLNVINNYVSPFNSYSQIKTSYDETGRITIRITYLYDEQDISSINNELSIITNKLKIDELSDKERIKAIHDYVIKNTSYDTNKGDGLDSEYDSSRANGVLFEHYGVCSGYADTVALLLDYYHIPNYKISSANHVWNAVYLNDNWYHLDATMDDPVSKNNVETLSDAYFLLNNEELFALKDSYDDHLFDQDYYLEFKTEN